MSEINEMTLSQIRRYSLEVTNFRLQEQAAMIGTVAVGAQGTKDSIKNTLNSLSDAQTKLSKQVTKRK